MGELMELWGFRRQLGRIWAVLFLSERLIARPTAEGFTHGPGALAVTAAATLVPRPP